MEGLPAAGLVLPPQALSNAAWAAVVLGCRPGAAWLGALQAAAEARMQHLSPYDLSQVGGRPW